VTRRVSARSALGGRRGHFGAYELKIGDRVKHRVAGEGTVADLSDGKVYVAFDRRKGKPQMLKKSTAEKKLKVIVFAGTSK